MPQNSLQIVLRMMLRAETARLKWMVARNGQVLFTMYDKEMHPTTTCRGFLFLDPGTGSKASRLNGSVMPSPDNGVVCDADGWKYLAVDFLDSDLEAQAIARIESAVALITKDEAVAA